MPDNRADLDHPVQVVETGSRHDDPRAPEAGTALCLSGGGYRAMLFHVGSIWRLNELGYLPKLKRVSSVSGGSITAGLLGLKWPRLGFDATGVAAHYVTEVVEPIRALAATTVDRGAILKGLSMPGTIADRVAAAYRAQLFGDATLQDLPDDPPRFVINATNVQTGALFRFSRPYIADYRLGQIRHPTVPLATAVAASSAFPPVLSPATIAFAPSDWQADAGGNADLHEEPYLSQVVLTDGGVYDNLGLETAWKRYDTILVSNGGGKMAAEAAPKVDWARHAVRVNEIIDNQVRSLRVRHVIDAFKAGLRKGAYWGIRTDIRDYRLANALDCPFEATSRLAETKTRLKALPDRTQESLINWGYAVCDAAMRAHVDAALPPPAALPYPASGLE